MRIRITTTDGMLGTASADPEIYEKFIGGKLVEQAKKYADEETRNRIEAEHKGTVGDELSTLETAEDAIEKSMTVFHKNDDGIPILYDYQIRGFIKEMFGILVEFHPEKIGKVTLSKWTFKRFVDNYIFVSPREIPLNIPSGSSVTTCSRPLRATTMKGDRVALAHSEEVAQGTTFEIDITVTEPKLEALVRKALDLGVHKGIGQWRNSGKGRFTWEEIK